MKEKIIIIIVVILAVIGTGMVVMVAVDISEENECKEWTLEANRLKDYYFTQWQADQCSAHNITINAPIK